MACAHLLEGGRRSVTSWCETLLGAPGVASLRDLPWALQRCVEAGTGHFLPHSLHDCYSGIGLGPALVCPSCTGQLAPVGLVQLRLGASPTAKTGSPCPPQSPKGFLESYEEMLSYALRPETWATTRLELEGRGVSCLH